MRIYGFTQYGGPDVAGFLDVADPAPGPGEVLVRMRAAGVNPADIKVRSGRRPAVPVRFPMAMGREAAGEVVATGEGSAFAVGDRVFGSTAPATGGLAERVLLTAASAARVPDGLDWAAAASIPVSAGTAWDAVDQLAVPAGGTLLVMGAGGGVGSAVVQVARARGVRVIGVASAGKHDLIERLGAVPVTSGPGWTERVRAAIGTAAGTVAAVMDTVGRDVLRDAAGLRADGASLISIADPDTATRLGGSGVQRHRTTAVYAAVAAAVVAGELDIVVATYPFARAAEAVAVVEDGHARGNVAVLG